MDLMRLLNEMDSDELHTIFIVGMLSITGVVITLSAIVICNWRGYREKKLAGMIVRDMLEQNRNADEIDLVLRIWMKAGTEGAEKVKLPSLDKVGEYTPNAKKPPVKAQAFGQPAKT